MNTIKKRVVKGRNTKRNYGQASTRRTSTKRKAVSSIDPNSLIKKGVVAKKEDSFVPSRTFLEMPINNQLKANIAKKGFKFPTQIQDETLESLMAGRDLVGIANTGTGKTGAFLIPIIERFLKGNISSKALVVVPTRELALQVENEFKSLTHGLGLYAVSLIGGTSVGKDISMLRRQFHLVIGTPGRLMDMVDRGALRLQEINTLVLDEFDRMLDMGFVNDIKKMVGLMRNRKQTMLFSATIDKTQKGLVDALLSNPVQIRVSSGTSTSDQIEQDIIRVPHGADKFSLLLELIKDESFEKVLIFAETKRMVDKVSKNLNQSGIKTDMIHGNKSQNYRNNALTKFKKGHVKILVATDVAARGIDVSDVTHVINYQLPLTFDSYVHRIGRTGRAGKTGKAFTFVD